MYLPDFVLDNVMFNQVIETSDEWITTRTGIKERRIEQEKYNYEMSGEACKSALENAGLQPEQIDMILLSTVTPDYTSPSTACFIQNYIGAENAVAFDVSAACSGFVFVLDIADLYIKSGRAKNILVVSSDITTRFADYSDRGNCILFGDGSGAVVVSACESEERRGIISSYIKTEPDGHKVFSIHIPLYNKPCEIFSEDKIFKGNTVKSDDGYIKQNGREAYQFVVKIVPQILEKVTADAGIAITDLDYIVLHQANKRILQYVIEKYKLDPAKVPISIEKYGNTSASSVPIVLHELNAANKLKQGDMIAVAGFGAGLSYGAAVIKW
jgi:3-oxoacyl-[acyl-carrier-protein] synthase-3